MLRINDNIAAIGGEQLQRVIGQLPEWRRDVVMRYKFESGRRESALAFLLLQEMSGLRDITFDIGEHGKPSIAGHPELHFNISHCSNGVACSVGSVPVGVDIECTGRYKEDLARYTLSDAELHTLYYMPDGTPRTAEDTDLQFTILWTQKEALLKLLGTGITDDLKSVLMDHEGKVRFHTIVNVEKGYVCTEAMFA